MPAPPVMLELPFLWGPQLPEIRLFWISLCSYLTANIMQLFGCANIFEYFLLIFNCLGNWRDLLGLRLVPGKLCHQIASLWHTEYEHFKYLFQRALYFKVLLD